MTDTARPFRPRLPFRCRPLRGLPVGYLCNVSDRRVRGLPVGYLCNVSDRRVRGLTVGYLCNFSARAVTLGCLPVTAGGGDPPGDGHGAGVIMCVN